MNIDAGTKRALEELSEREDVTVTEVVRRAISVYKFVEDELADGDQTLQLVDKETKERAALTLV